jgi:hypothetical protein
MIQFAFLVPKGGLAAVRGGTVHDPAGWGHWCHDRDICATGLGIGGTLKESISIDFHMMASASDVRAGPFKPVAQRQSNPEG